jgi:hypothetical protein
VQWPGPTLTIVNNDDPENPLVYNDDYFLRNSGIVFEVPQDGDYGVVIASYSADTLGEYRLAMAVNNPAVLDGAFIENGSDLLDFNPSRSFLRASASPIQVIADGRFRLGQDPVDLYDICNLRIDETLYVYMRRLTNGLDPLIRLRGPVIDDPMGTTDSPNCFWR